MALAGAQAGTRLAGPVRAGAAMALCICVQMAVGLAVADTVRCPDSNVAIHSADRAEAGAACEAAGNALGFLAAQGADTTGKVEVHLVSKLPDAAGPRAFGCYDRPDRRTYMLVFSEFLKQGTWSDLPLDRALYQSLLTHEVAHAVAAANFLVSTPSVRAHEYVAYVTMLATMPAAQRERLLAKFPGEGYGAAREMSTIFYLIAPFRFAAETYRHFLKPGNGKAFLTEVLAGRALIGEDGP